MNEILLPQIIAIGMYNAHVVFKNKNVSLNRKTTMFELEIPIGNGGVSYIDDTSHTISENLVICAKPGQMRHTRLPFKCYYLHMIVNEGQLSDMLSSLPNFIDLANANEIRKIFVALCTHYDMKTPEDNIMLQSLILQLVYKLNHYASSSKTKYNPKRNNQNTINRMINYIHENLTSDLSLKTLSESANYSPIYFHRLFKASTGKTLREYVEEQRIKKAIELLLSTEMTLTQIAYACGFSSQSYFSYAFKKKMKCTPREYTNAIHLKYESNNTFE